MKHFITHAVVASLLLVALAVPASALAAVFAGQEVIEVTEAIADDVFLTGERIKVSGAIQDDAFIAGGTIEVTAPIGEDLMAVAEGVSLLSAVDDDAFLAGDIVTVTGEASVDDLFAAGRVVELGEKTEVRGDVYAAGSTVVLNGAIAGSVRVAGETVEIGSTAKIAGDLIVYSATAPTIAEGATIGGDVRHVTAMAKDEDSARSLISDWVRDVVTWFLASLVLLYLAPRLGAAVTERVYTTTLSSFGIGLVWLIAMVPVAIALMLTVVGRPLALIVIFLSGLLLMLSMALLPLVIGTWIHQKFSSLTTRLPLQWQHALLGAVVTVTLGLVPVIGSLVVFVVMVAILGTLLRALKENS